jgi:hypothetical protein
MPPEIGRETKQIRGSRSYTRNGSASRVSCDSRTCQNRWDATATMKQ